DAAPPPGEEWPRARPGLPGYTRARRVCPPGPGPPSISLQRFGLPCSRRNDLPAFVAATPVLRSVFLRTPGGGSGSVGAIEPQPQKGSRYPGRRMGILLGGEKAMVRVRVRAPLPDGRGPDVARLGPTTMSLIPRAPPRRGSWP